MKRREYCAEHEFYYLQGGDCYYCKGDWPQAPAPMTASPVDVSKEYRDAIEFASEARSKVDACLGRLERLTAHSVEAENALTRALDGLDDALNLLARVQL